ncbi:rbr-type e3 ubiquitin transferase [Anaeramoeba flamelloides]|uniref:Rbr-type e3 ubiquitin transferase n=1 Tax=Anaeramoeba flamelloides TaxID=1746091 RepID=A0AAV7ZRY8_9EUKA|nr:rbr-type e3 ubiquitin transferase [Anaeramoeba flamelloides]|eukprot:Anaeramoba_flamelloidesa591999_31.p1 GENE.a591999_31~~a591999_31.p1  ORF type:complete len:381 (+),score=103.66 a591999_31:61-1203(+)
MIPTIQGTQNLKDLNIKGTFCYFPLSGALALFEEKELTNSLVDEIVLSCNEYNYSDHLTISSMLRSSTAFKSKIELKSVDRRVVNFRLIVEYLENENKSHPILSSILTLGDDSVTVFFERFGEAFTKYVTFNPNNVISEHKKAAFILHESRNSLINYLEKCFLKTTSVSLSQQDERLIEVAILLKKGDISTKNADNADNADEDIGSDYSDEDSNEDEGEGEDEDEEKKGKENKKKQENKKTKEILSNEDQEKKNSLQIVLKDLYKKEDQIQQVNKQLQKQFDKENVQVSNEGNYEIIQRINDLLEENLNLKIKAGLGKAEGIRGNGRCPSCSKNAENESASLVICEKCNTSFCRMCEKKIKKEDIWNHYYSEGTNCRMFN